MAVVVWSGNGYICSDLHVNIATISVEIDRNRHFVHAQHGSLRIVNHSTDIVIL